MELIADLSHWNFKKGITQAEIETQLATAQKAGLVAVIFKCSEGLTVLDEVYPLAQIACRKLGLLFGAYHFGRDYTGIAQADYFLAHCNYQSDMLVALDFEASINILELEAFVNRIYEKIGRYPVIYSRTSYLDLFTVNSISVIHKCALWIASYQTSANYPDIWDTYALWQYTNNVDGPQPHGLPGIETHVDLNWFNPRFGKLVDWWSKGYVNPVVLAAIADSFVSPVTGNKALWLNSPVTIPGVWYSANNYGNYYELNGSFSYHTGVDLNMANDLDAHKPVYSVGNGVVIFSDRIFGSTWGNIIVIECTLPDNSKVWFRYAHVENVLVKYGDIVTVGQQIASVGNAYGLMPYHLHFDVSTNRAISIGYTGAKLWPKLNMTQLTQTFTDPYLWMKKYLTDNPDTTTPLIKSMFVNQAIGLNIRLQPSITSSLLGFIPYKTQVNVDPTQLSNGYIPLYSYGPTKINGYILPRVQDTPIK